MHFLLEMMIFRCYADLADARCLPFLPSSWNGKLITLNERKLILEGPMFHVHDCVGRVNSYSPLSLLFFEMKMAHVCVLLHGGRFFM